MTLDFLDFDFSEDDDGNGSFDTMASVSPAQWPALQEELRRVLSWAHRTFPGGHGGLEDGGMWDAEIQGVRETPTPLALHYDASTGKLQAAEGAPGQPRITVSLTLSGTPGFCAALREAFQID